MFVRGKRVDERLDKIESLLGELRHDAELLRTVLVIREPDTVTAANAYEGLRKQIVAVAQEHWAHLAQLVEIDVSINHTDSIEVTRGLVDDWLIRAGVRRISQPTDSRQLTELFEDLGGHGSTVEIRSPAYVDSATGRLIRKGRFARVEARSPLPPARPERATGQPEESGGGTADVPDTIDDVPEEGSVNAEHVDAGVDSGGPRREREVDSEPVDTQKDEG